MNYSTSTSIPVPWSAEYTNPNKCFFLLRRHQAYGTGAEHTVTENQIIHLGEGNEALYGFTWNTEEERDKTK
ncbi:hypothetical protein JCM18909_381 [Cutibacterium acnes JCM 18909]|nr:hypothetical protein JCM18909_381 [Cutibacterium acnes JCM 18909]